MVKQYNQVISTNTVENTIYCIKCSSANLESISNHMTKENWSPTSKRRLSHLVFTDSTEKQSVEQYETMYDNTNKPCDGSDLATLLLMIYNNKYPINAIISILYSILTRIKQQYNMSFKQVTIRKSSIMSVDDSILTTFQTLLNDVFIKYDNHNLILSSDTTCIDQSEFCV